MAMEAMMNIVQNKVSFNRIFKEFNQSRCRYRMAKGSAGSGKSVNIAQGYILKLSDVKYTGANLLVARKIEETNRDSTFAELQAAIFRIFGEHYNRFWKFNLNPLMMECRITGSRIIFKGMKDAGQREKTKSITFKHGKLTDVWLEETTEFLSEDLDILDDRLRGSLDFNPNLFYQVTGSFNPVSATHWIKGRFFDERDPEVFAHHSTYLDNRFIDGAYHERMERRKKHDPEGYRIYGLGEWGELGGLILNNIDIHEFDAKPDCFDSNVIGQDFGFNHANAILDVGFKDGEIYIKRELYCFGKDTTEIIEIAKSIGLSKSIEMFCDSAEPDRIKTWGKAGFRAKPVKKEAGSVKAQIDFLKGRKIHIHPSCTNTIKEVQQWKWKKDSRTGLYIDEPIEIFDDAMAALRYSVERMRLGNGTTLIGKRLF